MAPSLSRLQERMVLGHKQMQLTGLLMELNRVLIPSKYLGAVSKAFIPTSVHCAIDVLSRWFLS